MHICQHPRTGLSGKRHLQREPNCAASHAHARTRHTQTHAPLCTRTRTHTHTPLSTRARTHHTQTHTTLHTHTHAHATHRHTHHSAHMCVHMIWAREPVAGWADPQSPECVHTCKHACAFPGWGSHVWGRNRPGNARGVQLAPPPGTGIRHCSPGSHPCLALEGSGLHPSPPDPRRPAGCRPAPLRWEPGHQQTGHWERPSALRNG